MSFIEPTRSVPLGSITTLRIVSFIERLWDGFIAWRTTRATTKALAALSDAQLSDIGINRGEILELAETLARR